MGSWEPWVLTTHAAEQAAVGGGQGDVGVVVTIKPHPQAKGRLQDNKLATQVDLNPVGQSQRGDGSGPVHLERRQNTTGELIMNTER